MISSINLLWIAVGFLFGIAILTNFRIKQLTLQLTRLLLLQAVMTAAHESILEDARKEKEKAKAARAN